MKLAPRALAALFAMLQLSTCGSGAGTSNATSTSSASSSTTALTQTPDSAASPTPAALSTSGPFHGLLQFNGTRHPRPTDPHVRGAEIITSWAQVEPSPGVYDWSLIDQAAALWAAQGKRIAIRVQSLTVQGDGFPSWLSTVGAQIITDHNGLKAPVYWDPIYLAQLHSMIDALAARYDGDARVLWVQAAVGVWGETKVQDDINSTHLPPAVTQPWFNAGYTDAVWFATIQKIVGYYLAAFHKTPLVTALAHGFVDGSKGYTQETITGWLTAHGVGTQDDGLRNTTTDNDPNIHRTMHIEEQLHQTAVSGDNLATMLHIAVSLGSAYILVYEEDLARPDYQQTLAAYAAQAS